MSQEEAVTGGDDPSESPRMKALAERLQRLIHRAFESRPAGRKLKNFLNGAWLGHPLHVVLTDVPIGAWTTAEILDLCHMATGKEDFGTAADAAMAVGLAGAVAAALAGATDWQDADAPARRIGLIHGLLNLGGAGLFAASLVLRRRGARGAGRLLSAVAYAGMTYSARLGGDMVYKHRLGVDRTAGQSFPAEFTPVHAEADLPEGAPKRAEYARTPIVLVRRGQRVFALAETCSHFGGPLSEGKLLGDSIQCPWHGSRFALEDGRVLDGPAVHPQPCLEARVRDGKIEVRLAPAKPAPALAAPVTVALRPVA